jgi:hypothetical protein
MPVAEGERMYRITVQALLVEVAAFVDMICRVAGSRGPGMPKAAAPPGGTQRRGLG